MSTLRIGLVSLGLLLFGIPSIASAYVIYNKSSKDGHFYGEFCHRCYAGKIEWGAKAACPGNEAGCGGETMIFMDSDDHCGLKPPYRYCPIKVDAHGWIEIYDGPKCVVFTSGGQVKSGVAPDGRSIGGVDEQGNPIPVGMIMQCGQ